MAQTQAAAFPAQNDLLDRVFHLTENQTTVHRELLGGLTTFMAMAYVVVVNPRILGEAGMPVEGVLFATCISAAIATLVMGVWANYPIAVAPGMSLNAYFTYSVVLGRHVPWQTALGVVFLSGVIFLILTLTKVRENIVNDIPDCLKHGTAAGIGFFIAFIGMRNAQLIVANPATFVGIGKMGDPQVLLALLGLVVIVILMVKRVTGCDSHRNYRYRACWHTAQTDQLAGSLSLPAASFGHVHETGLALRKPSRARRTHLRVLLCGPLRQCGHAGGRLRTGWVFARRKIPSCEPGFALGCIRHHNRRPYRNLHGYQLYRKRRRSCGWRANGTGQRSDRRAICRGDVLCADRGGDSLLCHGARADSGWRAHVQLNSQNPVE